VKRFDKQPHNTTYNFKYQFVTYNGNRWHLITWWAKWWFWYFIAC